MGDCFESQQEEGLGCSNRILVSEAEEKDAKEPDRQPRVKKKQDQR